MTKRYPLKSFSTSTILFLSTVTKHRLLCLIYTVYPIFWTLPILSVNNLWMRIEFVLQRQYCVFVLYWSFYHFARLNLKWLHANDIQLYYYLLPAKMSSITYKIVSWRNCRSDSHETVRNFIFFHWMHSRTSSPTRTLSFGAFSIAEDKNVQTNTRFSLFWILREF